MTSIRPDAKRAIAALAFILMGANANAQSETVPKANAADQSGQNSSQVSIVKGRAVYEDSGQPAPRERVQLVAIELLSGRHGRIPTTMTDANRSERSNIGRQRASIYGASPVQQKTRVTIKAARVSLSL